MTPLTKYTFCDCCIRFTQRSAKCLAERQLTLSLTKDVGDMRNLPRQASAILCVGRRYSNLVGILCRSFTRRKLEQTTRVHLPLLPMETARMHLETSMH